MTGLMFKSTEDPKRAIARYKERMGHAPNIVSTRDGMPWGGLPGTGKPCWALKGVVLLGRREEEVRGQGRLW